MSMHVHPLVLVKMAELFNFCEEFGENQLATSLRVVQCAYCAGPEFAQRMKDAIHAVYEQDFPAWEAEQKRRTQ